MKWDNPSFSCSDLPSVFSPRKGKFTEQNWSKLNSETQLHNGARGNSFRVVIPCMQYRDHSSILFILFPCFPTSRCPNLMKLKKIQIPHWNIGLSYTHPHILLRVHFIRNTFINLSIWSNSSFCKTLKNTYNNICIFLLIECSCF